MINKARQVVVPLSMFSPWRVLRMRHSLRENVFIVSVDDSSSISWWRSLFKRADSTDAKTISSLSVHL